MSVNDVMSLIQGTLNVVTQPSFASKMYISVLDTLSIDEIRNDKIPHFEEKYIDYRAKLSLVQDKMQALVNLNLNDNDLVCVSIDGQRVLGKRDTVYQEKSACFLVYHLKEKFDEEFKKIEKSMGDVNDILQYARKKVNTALDPMDQEKGHKLHQ